MSNLSINVGAERLDSCEVCISDELPDKYVVDSVDFSIAFPGRPEKVWESGPFDYGLFKAINHSSAAGGRIYYALFVRPSTMSNEDLAYQEKALVYDFDKMDKANKKWKSETINMPMAEFRQGCMISKGWITYSSTFERYKIVNSVYTPDKEYIILVWYTKGSPSNVFAIDFINSFELK